MLPWWRTATSPGHLHRACSQGGDASPQLDAPPTDPLVSNLLCALTAITGLDRLTVAAENDGRPLDYATNVLGRRGKHLVKLPSCRALLKLLRHRREPVVPRALGL